MQNSEYKVTIGIPVFQVEKYIKATLTTALEQDFNDLEILIVDDCGNDKSMDIIRNMQNSHPKGKCIHIIQHPENRGAAEARNTIIKNAMGKYIYFLDSDDLVKKSTISTLYRSAEEVDAEVTYGSMTICDENEEKYSVILPSITLIGKDALGNYIYSNIYKNLPDSSCNILIRTDFLHKNHILYPDFKIGEDLMFNELLQPKVTRAVLLSDITYYYVRHPNSLMNFQSRNIIDIKEVYGSLKYSELQKEICLSLKHKPYYSGKCAKTMKSIFYSACGILKHRQQLNGKISNKEIRNLMQHPADFSEILKFKQQRNINLLFWLMGVLPPALSVSIMKVLGKRLGYIK